MAVDYMIATVVRVVVDFVFHKCRQRETLWKEGHVSYHGMLVFEVTGALVCKR